MKNTYAVAIAITAVIISVGSVLANFYLQPSTSGTSGQPTGTENIGEGSITEKEIKDGTITDADITSSGISKIGTETIESDQIANNSILLNDLSTEVTEQLTGVGEIADGSITSKKIADENVTGNDIKNGTVGSSELKADSVGSSELTDDAVGSSEIQNNSIGAPHLGPLSVGTSELTTDSVTSSKISSDAVGSEEIADDSVGSDELKNGAVSWGDVTNKPMEVVAAGVIEYTAGAPPHVDIEENYGIESARWDHGNSCFEISMKGVNYQYLNFVTNVTPSGSEPMMGVTTSVNDNLIVLLYDNTGMPVSEDFHFVTYRVP